MRSLLALSVTFLGTACGPEVALPSWERVDLDELERRLDEPTASLDDLQIPAEEFAALSSEADTFRELARSLADLQANSDGSAASNLDVEEDEGSVAFVELACPGADLERPLKDFSAGWARLDIPGLAAAQALRGQFRFSGSVLVSFVGCRWENVQFDGSCPAFVASDGRIGVQPRLAVRADGDDGPEQFDLASDAILTQGEIRFLSMAVEGFTVRVAFDDRTEVELIGSDGRLVCSLETGACERL